MAGSQTLQSTMGIRLVPFTVGESPFIQLLCSVKIKRLSTDVCKEKSEIRNGHLSSGSQKASMFTGILLWSPFERHASYGKVIDGLCELQRRAGGFGFVFLCECLGHSLLLIGTEGEPERQ